MVTKIKVAGHVIEIESVYKYFFLLSQSFITDEPAEIKILTTQEDIANKRQLTGISQKQLTDRRLEVTIIHRKVTEYLLNFDILLMHGAAIAIGQEAFIFSGKSGVGKTTHILKWLKNDSDVIVINGDKPFIKVDERSIACGSPWAGKEEMHSNVDIPIKAIVLMERNEKNSIERIPISEAVPFLLQQIYCPDDEGLMRTTIKLLNRLITSVSFWRFKCNNFEENCFDVAYNALVKNNHECL